MPSSFSP
jgi:hypothetical protein